MGIRTITEPCYVDALPSPDRTPAPAAELELGLLQHGECRRLSARISMTQCRYNRAQGSSVCAGCPGLTPPAVVPAAPADGISLHFSGENAEVIRRFAAGSRSDGHDPADDLATVIDLFMAGRLRLVTRRTKS